MRSLLRFIEICVGAAVLLIASYFLYNTPFKSKYSDLSPEELKVFTDYLDSSACDPFRFVSDKFTTHDVVLIGEPHRWKQEVDFVRELIPYLYRNNHVTVVGWEFGSSDYQSQVDSIVTAPYFDETAAIRVMRLRLWSWNYQEYLDFFKTIWELNRSIPDSAEKIRFLQLASDYDARKLNSPDPNVRLQEAIRSNYDGKMADIIEREVLRTGKKALWYSGLHHAFTSFRQPTYLFRVKNGADSRGGNLLFERFPDRVYLIALHFPALSRWAIVSELTQSDPTYLLPFAGVIDAVYDNYRRPFAFDNSLSPFGELEDSYSYYSVDRWQPLTLKEFCDGYIILSSFQEAQAVTPIQAWVSSQADLAETKDRMTEETAASVHNQRDLINMIDGDRLSFINKLHKLERDGK